jgi:hypothetical protein
MMSQVLYQSATAQGHKFNKENNDIFACFAKGGNWFQTNFFLDDGATVGL